MKRVSGVFERMGAYGAFRYRDTGKLILTSPRVEKKYVQP